MGLNVSAVKKSFAVLQERTQGDSERLTHFFYGRLFAENPQLRTMFPPAMDVQRERLFAALTRIMTNLDDPEALRGFLGRLGRDHRKFGVEPEHYAAVGGALLATARRFLGEAWTPEVADAWSAAYEAAAGMMVEAAEEHSAWAPPWWNAEVVELARPWHDIVDLTLRPDQPYPFQPGQYLSLQTARWPRVWRPYSIANAPRSDNRLRLLVRAVPGGWVSGALLRHTRPGDGVALGAPQGSMVLDASSRRDLVLAAGGTGIAPLKALLEQVVTLPRRRSVLLFYAAATREELTELEALEELRVTYPWLTPIPVLREAGAHARADGLEVFRGTLPEAIARHGPFEDRDAYLSGPEGLVQATAEALVEAGVARGRIRHDPFPSQSTVPAHEEAPCAHGDGAPEQEGEEQEPSGADEASNAVA
jgi:ferredoxin-NADP reductase/hemoglobin-like flavoprotein